MSKPRYMNNRVQDLGNNVVSVECPIEYTDGYRVTCGWSEDDGAWIAEVSGVSTGSILADGPTRELAVLALVTSCCATVDAVNDHAVVAALTAENAQLRETLTLGLGEQESVIAGLRAENERLDRAQRDHFTLREELRIACETGMRLNLPAEQIVARIRDSLGADAARFAIRDRESRAALPSSRETTDG